MAFTTWSALKTAIKDALADAVAGSPCTGSYRIKDREVKYRSYEELYQLYQRCCEMEAIESSGDPDSMVSYGRFRRY